MSDYETSTREAALIAEAQPHLPGGTLHAGDTTTAAQAEAQQATPEAVKQVHETGEHTNGVAEHAASTARQTRGSGVTGNARNAVSQLRANVEKTTDAAVAEGQKSVQAAADAGARYIEEAKSLASNAISSATSYLPASLKGGTTGSTAKGGPGNNEPPGSFPSSNAPQESGPRAVDGPYPASDVHAQQVVVNESK
ncbi:hypothetical protein DFH94DRAFT_734439 [Russula ochroleuca]|uniref:Uncharacterized protein n=1 Tax=Russula ochroleuca TaxID=152965 RepID=A0A9P5TAW6_9AGAM|nr:hypothetical protein DFH94DRAFT_734439 [Russula ochroleuca]